MTLLPIADNVDDKAAAKAAKEAAKEAAKKEKEAAKEAAKREKESAKKSKDSTKKLSKEELRENLSDMTVRNEQLTSENFELQQRIEKLESTLKSVKVAVASC